jgi:hypothetical protein
LDVAHQVLATFGITEPTPEYERWVKPDGFAMEDLCLVLADSRFIIVVDWRGFLIDALELIARAVSELGSQLTVDVDEDANEGNEGWVSCEGRRAHVKYVPKDRDDFTDVTIAIQKLVPASIEFRESPDNADNDEWRFAVLLRTEWKELESLDRQLVDALFQPLGMGRRL